MTSKKHRAPRWNRGAQKNNGVCWETRRRSSIPSSRKLQGPRLTEADVRLPQFTYCLGGGFPYEQLEDRALRQLFCGEDGRPPRKVGGISAMAHHHVRRTVALGADKADLISRNSYLLSERGLDRLAGIRAQIEQGVDLAPADMQWLDHWVAVARDDPWSTIAKAHADDKQRESA